MANHALIGLIAGYASLAMATKRKRPSGGWEYIIRRKGLLPKAVSFTFRYEAEGAAYVARLEALLDRGVVSPELVDERPDIATIADSIRGSLVAVSVAESDKPLLNTLCQSAWK